MSNVKNASKLTAVSLALTLAACAAPPKPPEQAPVLNDSLFNNWLSVDQSSKADTTHFAKSVYEEIQKTPTQTVKHLNLFTRNEDYRKLFSAPIATEISIYAVKNNQIAALYYVENMNFFSALHSQDSFTQIIETAITSHGKINSPRALIKYENDVAEVFFTNLEGNEDLFSSYRLSNLIKEAASSSTEVSNKLVPYLNTHQLQPASGHEFAPGQIAQMINSAIRISPSIVGAQYFLNEGMREMADAPNYLDEQAVLFSAPAAEKFIAELTPDDFKHVSPEQQKDTTPEQLKLQDSKIDLLHAAVRNPAGAVFFQTHDLEDIINNNDLFEELEELAEETLETAENNFNRLTWNNGDDVTPTEITFNGMTLEA